MKCPACGNPDSHVLDSRPVEDGASIKRRRECGACGKRFTTYEVIDSVPLMVVKKDGTREIFDKHKLLSGILKACQKRPVDAEAVVADIEKELTNSLASEITSSEIGEMVMDRLRKLDAVAYVRFASVYREFKDVDTFLDELNKMIRASRSATKKRAASGSGKK
jgi:transcriptional repressor NrdR